MQSQLLLNQQLKRSFAQKEAHQQRVRVEQLCIAQKVPMVKVLGDHRVSKVVAVDQVVAADQAVVQVEVAVQVAEEITRTPDLN